MILTCPQCATRYQTDAAQFAPAGRKVRCAKCTHVWHQAAPEPEADALDIPRIDEPPAVDASAPQRAAYASDHAPQPSYAVPAAVPRAPSSWLRGLGIAAGWLVLAGIVLVIGWSAVIYRQQVATLWPQSSSLYKALGLHVNTRGIDIRYVSSSSEKEDGQSVLAITGTLVNFTSRELTVPPITVVLTDKDKRELYQWSFAPGVATLQPNQPFKFRTRLSNPPAGARQFEVRFAGSGG
jgi:predicted Zn finger-like uncharacterized protein